MTTAYVNNTYEQRYAAGMCIKCGKTEFRHGAVTCETCILRDRVGDRELKDFRKAHGLCRTCGAQLPAGSRYLTCEKDRAHDRGRTQAERARRKENNLCLACGSQKEADFEMCNKCRKKSIDLRAELKSTVILKYSPSACCQCCGEPDIRFLQVDHIDNDGAQHRKAVAGTSLYQWLRTNHYPPGFQILCASCNIGKSLNNGVCPHQDDSYPTTARVDKERYDILTSNDAHHVQTKRLNDLAWSRLEKPGSGRGPAKRVPERKPCPRCGSTDTMRQSVKRTPAPHITLTRACRGCGRSWNEELNPNLPAIVLRDRPSLESRN